MTDGRIPGKWMNEPRFIEMSADAWCVFTKAIAWSNEAGTDGFIKWRYLSLLHPDGDHPAANAELVEFGLWTKMPTGYQLFDWDRPAHQGGLGQSTAEQVRTGKERKRDNQRAYRERLADKEGEQVTDLVPGDVTGHMTDHVGQDTTGHAQMTEQLESELQDVEGVSSGQRSSSWPCSEPGCSVVLTEKSASRHDCRGYRDDRFGASSAPWDLESQRRSA